MPDGAVQLASIYGGKVGKPRGVTKEELSKLQVAYGGARSAKVSLAGAGTLPVEPDELNATEFEAYEALRTWRNTRSRELEIEPYKICNNRSLSEMVRTLPTNDEELLEVWGLGPAKVERFGEKFLEVLGEYRQKILEAQKKDEETRQAEEDLADLPEPKAPEGSGMQKTDNGKEVTEPRGIDGVVNCKTTTSGDSNNLRAGRKRVQPSPPGRSTRRRGTAMTPIKQEAVAQEQEDAKPCQSKSSLLVGEFFAGILPVHESHQHARTGQVGPLNMFSRYSKSAFA